MKAIVQNRYGTADVLELRDIERPIAKDDEMLVHVRAASIHADVWHVMRGVPYVLRFMGAGVRRPKNLVPGTDLAGEVVSIGRNVTRFRPGHEVFGQSLTTNCGVTGAPSPSTQPFCLPGSSRSLPASRSSRPRRSRRPDHSRSRAFAMRAVSRRISGS